MSDNLLGALLTAQFEANEVKHFEGRGGRTFDYIEDETVMDRLDMVFGVGNWNTEITAISVADGIVKVRIYGVTPGGVPWSHEGHGYASNAGPQAELLKEAESDGIRRVGRYLGIARDLYRKHESTASGGGRGPSSPARPPAPTRPTVVHDSVPDEPDDLFADRDEFAPIGVAHPGDLCDEHGVEWRGETGDLYHKKAEGGYCRHPGNTKKARRA